MTGAFSPAEREALARHRDVCPSTRLRCPDPARCWREHCGGGRDLHPVAEHDLTREELYHLRVEPSGSPDQVEQRAAQRAALLSGQP